MKKDEDYDGAGQAPDSGSQKAIETDQTRAAEALQAQVSDKKRESDLQDIRSEFAQRILLGGSSVLVDGVEHMFVPKDTAGPVPPDPATSIIAVIQRAALDPAVDIDKMERLLLMQERIMERQAEMAFNAALADVQAEMVPVVRDADNDQTHSKYARLEAISRAVTPITTSHGFAMSFGSDVSPMDNHYRVTCRVSHAEGHARDYHADVPVDLAGMQGKVNKTATHAFGSTMSYGRRYLKLLIFDIATSDDDDGNRAGAGPTVNPEQFTKLRTLLDNIGKGDGAFLKHYRVSSLEQIPAAKFSDAEDLLNDKVRRKTKGAE